MSTELNRIEAIVSDIERSERETGGQFTEPQDLREALEIIARIEQRMIERAKSDKLSETA